MLKGDFDAEDSAQIYDAYGKAYLAVGRMKQALSGVWEVDERGEEKKLQRVANWNADPTFREWLGEPDQLGKVRRRVNRIHSKFEKRLILEVKKANTGRCTGWISAWTMPFGRLKIRLCEDFFVYRTHLQEKVLIHEMGHETGILFHRKVHGCRAARRAANSNRGVIAKKSTENYAWLAVSYLGISCSSR